MRRSFAVKTAIVCLGSPVANAGEFLLRPLISDVIPHRQMHDGPHDIQFHNVDPKTRLSPGDRVVLTVGSNNKVDVDFQKGFGFGGSPFGGSPSVSASRGLTSNVQASWADLKHLTDSQSLFSKEAASSAYSNHLTDSQSLFSKEAASSAYSNHLTDSQPLFSKEAVFDPVVHTNMEKPSEGTHPPSEAEVHALTNAEDALIKSIQNWAKENLESDVTVHVNTHFETDMRVDSLEKMDILLHVQKEFPKTVITDEESGNINTVADLLKAVQASEQQKP